VQYFERAVFEHHPENQPPYNVLLSLLGKFRFDSRGGGGGKVSPPTANGFAAPGWTNVVVSTNNIVLFYNSANGNAATAKLDTNGALTQLQRYPDKAAGNSAIVVGATHVLAVPNGRLTFYTKSTGDAANIEMGGDGRFGSGFAQEWGAGWAHMAIDVATGDGVYYKAGDNPIVTSRLKADGTFTPNKDNLYSPGWTHIMPVGGNTWFLYKQSTGDVATAKMSADITLVPLLLPTLDAGWTHVTYAGDSPYGSGGVYMYSKATGTAKTGFVNHETGAFSNGKSYTGLSKEWSHFASAPGGTVVIYSTETGRVATDRVDENGNATALQRYAPNK
jgi:hypothetical protein